MKIEICDNTRLIFSLAIAVIGIMSIVWIGSHYYNKRVLSAFDNGYEEGVLPGRGDVFWVKAK